MPARARKRLGQDNEPAHGWKISGKKSDLVKRTARLAAEVALRRGDFERARQDLARALALYPDNTDLQATATFLDEAMQIELPDQAPSTVDVDVGTAKEKNLAVQARAQRVVELGDSLIPLLKRFPSLGPRIRKVVLVPEQGSEEFILWPFAVHPDRLRDGFADAFSRSPYRYTVDSIASEIGDKPSNTQLTRIATDVHADAVVVYGLRSKGRAGHVSLMVFTLNNHQAYQDETLVKSAMDLGLVSWNPIFVGALIIIGGLLILWLVWRIIRGAGSIRVEIKGDPAAERPSFSVLISRRNKCPTVTDPNMHIANVTAAAKSSRYKADNVGAVEEFEGIAPGHWFVHVFGTFEKAGDVRCLPATSSPVKVRRSRVSVVSINLIPAESEFHILVTGEGGPASGALVWLSTSPANRRTTDVGGKTVMMVAAGEHILHILFRGHEVKRPITAYGSKITTVHINLVRERRLAEVAEGLQVDFGQSAESPMGDGEGGRSLATLAFETRNLGGENPVKKKLSIDSISDSETQALGSTETLAGLRRYQAESELGRGAMGVVYRAVDQVLDRAVALKVMTAAFREMPTAVQMFEQEAKALAALNHPNIVTVYDQGRDGDQMFLVMELIDGPTLEDVLKQHGALPIEQAAGLGEQIGRGLSYAHSRQVIHRDIKPGNIFLTRDGTAKLGDFGLARVLKEVQIKKTEIKGTPLYMPPEQIRGSDIDFRADIYALGCTLYEVLCGRPPFIEGEILYHHMYTEPEPLSHHVEVLPELEELIMRCIAKEKSERVSSADRIAEVFGSIRRSLG